MRQTRKRRTLKMEKILEKLPDKLTEKLMQFQKEGVKFAVEKKGRCLIADEMGLGKTLQAISIAYYYKSEWPLLIIVPSSLRYSWIEEFEKWVPDINPGEINLIQSGADSSGIQNSQVTITTFGLLSNAKCTLVKEALLKQEFKVVIVDESHYIKNIKTVTSKTVVPLVKNANRRILLSGTPALARPAELFPQIDAICPNTFGNWYSYTNRYCDAKLEWFGRQKRRNVNGASNLDELQQKLSTTLMIRREKSEVLTQLPPKQRQRILFELKDSELKKDIRSTFEELRSKLKQKSAAESYEVLTGGGDHDVKDYTLLQLIQQLYQLSGDAKIGPAKEYIEMLCDNPKLKFLIFAYHHNMMNGIAQSLYDKNVKFIRIDGNTPPADRPTLVNQFQSDPDTRVAVLSILAAGVGLTFTAATVVVFAEMYWTPGVMVQCEDRAHRIGQTSHVAIHYLIAKDTMDEWVWSAVCKKIIVTSKTLVGKRRKMEAMEGDKYQIDVLSKAEAWVPENNENLDLTGYFNSKLNPDQKSIKDFFSPPQHGTSKLSRLDKALSERNKKSVGKFCDISDEGVGNAPILSGALQERNRKTTRKDHDISSDEEDILENLPPPRKKLKVDQDKSLQLSDTKKKENHVVLIDIDDMDDFAVFKPKSTQKSQQKKSAKKAKVQTGGKSVESPLNTPKCNLVTIFNQGSAKSKEVCDSQICDSPSGCCSSKVKLKVSNQWSCESCTYLNHSELAYCEMCETPKKTRKIIKGISNHAHDESSSQEDDYNDSRTPQNKTTVFQGFNKKKGSETDMDAYKVNTPQSSESSQGTEHEIECGLDTDDEDQDNNSVNSSVNNTEKCRFSSSLNDDIETSDQNKNPIRQPKTDKEKRENVTKDVCVTASASPVTRISGVNDNHVKSLSSGKKYRFKSVKRDSIGKEHGSMIKDSELQLNREITSSKIDDTTNATKQDSDEDETESDGMKNSEINGSLSAAVVHSMFKYQCSKYTGRIYLLTQNDVPLNVNFLPIDVEVCNYDSLPEVLHHPSNLSLVQRFVREWQNLTETKRRLIIKSSRVFVSPLREYEDLQSCKTLNTQRHKTKLDTAKAAHTKAAEVSGSVRVISKTSNGQSAKKGVTQALDKDGTPLCLQCFKPYKNILLDQSTILSEENAWQTRFCGEKCAHNYWLVTNNDYMRNKMFEIEHGVCQMCKFDVHLLFRRIKDTQDQKKRAEILTSSKLNTLSTKTKAQIVKKPVAGQFWHVDHIIPVWEGGGQCDMDNLRTLCVLCHQKVTAKQAGKRATARKLESAVKSHDITAFFKAT